MKYYETMYSLDCRSFHSINRYFDHKLFNPFFRKVTHLGGATVTISIVLFLLVFTAGSIRQSAIASALALLCSHVPVVIVKKLYPRKRPYLVLKNSQVLDNPLTDCSFPSGHTTAIFSIIIPFILLFPILGFILFPIGVLVAISRVYLGLHYPSDILVGSLLGTFTGSFFYHVLMNGLFL